MTVPIFLADRLASLGARAFDLLVIGGGITGCGIARDAALRGLSVALVEKDDFASGTSSRSSRLVHGGVRYLEHGHVHLVFESSAERRRLLAMAPHLVRPLQFTWPVYAGARIPRWKLGAGLLLYDALALFRNVGRHKRLSRNDVLLAEPMLREDGLRGGAMYYDAATNDARLTLANAIGAAQAGAVVVNHAAVTALLFDDGRVIGATVRDSQNATTVEVRASVVVNATGPWNDDVRHLDQESGATVRGSKGVHIAVPRDRIGNTHAVTLISPIDGRVLFVLPANGHTIVGTTDTYTTSSPDDVRATNADVQYLLDAANVFFPAAHLTCDDVVSAWAGIRPLLPTKGTTPGAVTREHAIATSPSGLVSITGGKLTTYRIMAADVMDLVCQRLGRQAGEDRAKFIPLPGGEFTSLVQLIADAARVTKDVDLAGHLAGTFGTTWPAVWSEIIVGDGRTRLDDALPYTLGELRYSVRHEFARSLGDLLIRRTHLAFETRDHGLDAAPCAAATAAPLLGWSKTDTQQAVQDYAAEAERIFTID